MWFGPWKFGRSKKELLREAHVLALARTQDDKIILLRSAPEPGTPVWWLVEVTPNGHMIDLLIATDLVSWFLVEGIPSRGPSSLVLPMIRKSYPRLSPRLIRNEGKIQTKIYEGEPAEKLVGMGQGDAEIIAEAVNSFIDGGQ